MRSGGAVSRIELNFNSTYLGRTSNKTAVKELLSRIKPGGRNVFVSAAIETRILLFISNSLVSVSISVQMI